MDCINLSQHDFVRRWLTLSSIRQPSPSPAHSVAAKCCTRSGNLNPHRRSAIRAFWTVGLLNVPVAALVTILAARRTQRVSAAWKTWCEDSIAGQLFSYPLEYVGFKRWFCRTNSNFMFQRVDLSKWVPLFGLNATSLAEGRYWTVITANFSHVAADHLLTNMLGLWQFAPICADIPGLNWLHVSAVTIIASLSSSMASLAQMTYFPSSNNPWVASQATGLGFSGIAMAFLGLAATSSPRRAVMGLPITTTVPCWIVGSIVFLRDVWGLLHMMGYVRRVPWSPKMGNAGHLAHLAGFAIGALYYWLMLRPQPRSLAPNTDKQDPRTERGSGTIDETSVPGLAIAGELADAAVVV